MERGDKVIKDSAIVVEIVGDNATVMFIDSEEHIGYHLLNEREASLLGFTVQSIGMAGFSVEFLTNYPY